jgi:hypothetical protein
MRWERIAWAAVIAFLCLMLVVHMEDQTSGKEGIHIDKYFVILTVLIILTSWIAIRRKIKKTKDVKGGRGK